MSDVINLSRYRKARAKKQHEQKAQQNRVLFGRTKAQKARDDAEARAAQDRHELLRLEKTDD